jgi:CheY-like chemotaxis protein
MGCVVEEAVDGVDCVERVEAKNGAFDVILMDCEMPRMTGPQASESLTKKGYTVPVVALTAHALSTQRADCKKSGMVGFLTKPVQSEQLYDVLRGLVSEAPEVA